MRYAPLDLSLFDVCVIGGGVIGLSIAREIAGRNFSVCVVERGRYGGESSHAAAGMLAPQAEANTDNDFFRLACTSRDMYTDFACRLAEETGIDVELDLTGTLYIALTPSDEQNIIKRYEWQRGAGFEVEVLSAAQARELEPNISPDVRRALLFRRDGQVENRRLITALVASLEQRGGRLLPNTEVTELVVEKNRVSHLATSRGAITTKHYVLAGGAWSGQLLKSEGFTKAQHSVSVQPIRGQMLVFESVPRIVRHVVYSPRGYLVPRRDGRLLAGATTERAGFNKIVTARGVASVSTHALEISPAVADLPMIDSYAGLRPFASDGLPIIGAHPEIENLFLATAHYRNGILLAPLTAHAAADTLTDGRTLDAGTHTRLAAFSPARLMYNSIAASGDD